MRASVAAQDATAHRRLIGFLPVVEKPVVQVSKFLAHHAGTDEFPMESRTDAAVGTQLGTQQEGTQQVSNLHILLCQECRFDTVSHF